MSACTRRARQRKGKVEKEVSTILSMDNTSLEVTLGITEGDVSINSINHGGTMEEDLSSNWHGRNRNPYSVRCHIQTLKLINGTPANVPPLIRKSDPSK